MDFDTGHTTLCERFVFRKQHSDRGVEAAVGDQELRETVRDGGHGSYTG